MKLLVRLATLLALFVLAQLSSCAPARHDAEAAPRARRIYHRAERHHTRARHRAVPFYLPWN